jgi:hypothetical protein
MSMILFALCINPLLQNMENRLKGVPKGQTGRHVAVIIYAVNVTVALKRPEFQSSGDRRLEGYSERTRRGFPPNNTDSQHHI